MVMIRLAAHAAVITARARARTQRAACSKHTRTAGQSTQTAETTRRHGDPGTASAIAAGEHRSCRAPSLRPARACSRARTSRSRSTATRRPWARPPRSCSPPCRPRTPRSCHRPRTSRRPCSVEQGGTRHVVDRAQAASTSAVMHGHAQGRLLAGRLAVGRLGSRLKPHAASAAAAASEGNAGAQDACKGRLRKAHLCAAGLKHHVRRNRVGQAQEARRAIRPHGR